MDNMKNRNKILLVLLCTLVFSNVYAFIPGEKLTFSINYGVINAGEATLQIDNYMYKDSLSTYRILSTAKTNSFFDNFYKVRDTIESTWDHSMRFSHRFSKKLNEGHYKQWRIHTYNQREKTSIYSTYGFKKKVFTDTKIEIPAYSQDILSAFYFARTQNLQVGKTIPISVTTDGKSYNALVLIIRKEIVSTIFGKKECFVIQPKLQGESLFKQTGNIYIWVTADEHKVPVKLESKIVFGSFSAVLTSASKVPYPIIKK